MADDMPFWMRGFEPSVAASKPAPSAPPAELYHWQNVNTADAATSSLSAGSARSPPGDAVSSTRSTTESDAVAARLEWEQRVAAQQREEERLRAQIDAEHAARLAAEALMEEQLALERAQMEADQRLAEALAQEENAATGLPRESTLSREDRELAERLAEEEEKAAKLGNARTRVRADLHGAESCAVCMSDFSADLPGIAMCSTSPPHILCPVCATNMVRTQLEAGVLSMSCSVCSSEVTPSHAHTHTHGEDGAAAMPAPPGLRRQLSTGLILTEAVEYLFELCAAASRSAGRAVVPGDPSGDTRPLTEGEIRRWQMACTVRAANKAGDHVVLCPNPACSVPCWADGDVTAGDLSRRGERIACPSCAQQLCLVCGVAWSAEHEDKTCAAYRDMLAQRADVAAVTDALGDTFKQCPNCHIAIGHARKHACHHIRPKTGGADQGGCPNCHTHFCYVCLTVFPADSWSAHYRNGTCPLFCDEHCGCKPCTDCKPGKACPQCTGCEVCQAPPRSVREMAAGMMRPGRGVPTRPPEPRGILGEVHAMLFGVVRPFVADGAAAARAAEAQPAAALHVRELRAQLEALRTRREEHARATAGRASAVERRPVGGARHRPADDE